MVLHAEHLFAFLVLNFNLNPDYRQNNFDLRVERAEKLERLPTDLSRCYFKLVSKFTFDGDHEIFEPVRLLTDAESESLEASFRC